jgi:hypothetical protein
MNVLIMSMFARANKKDGYVTDLKTAGDLAEKATESYRENIDTYADEEEDEWGDLAPGPEDEARRKKAQDDLNNAGKAEPSPENYGKLIAAVRSLARHELHRKNGKGADSRTCLDIIEAQLNHYAFLRNHGVRRGELSKEDRRLIAIGTAACEVWDDFVFEIAPLCPEVTVYF